MPPPAGSAFTFDLPLVIHLPARDPGRHAGRRPCGPASPGLLKARTGAHEVIVTIMLNYVGYYLVFFALSRQGLLQAPGSSNPKSAPVKRVGDHAQDPR